MSCNEERLGTAILFQKYPGILKYTKNHCIVQLKWMNFKIYKICLNKVIKNTEETEGEKHIFKIQILENMQMQN